MIGVLALQGGFLAHGKMLDMLGVANREVRLPAELNELDGLIIPGGESTTMLKLLDAFGWYEELAGFGDRGKPVLGTCAGAILMSGEVGSHQQRSFGWIPVRVVRNAYGSQRESFFTQLSSEAWGLKDLPAAFIRAPKFTAPGEGVSAIFQYEEDIVGVQYRHFTAVTFHPELSDDPRFHRTWLENAGLI